MHSNLHARPAAPYFRPGWRVPLLVLAAIAAIGLETPAAQDQERIIPTFLDFSSYRWLVRENIDREGPGNNRFGGQNVSVFLNQDGSLVLALALQDGVWKSAEVSTSRYLGYGTYTFKVRTSPYGLDRNLVLGLFTYSAARGYNHREIDIEFSAWGQPGQPVAGQYVVQPYDKPGNMVFFDVSRVMGPATHTITWSETRLHFISWLGYGPRPEPGSPLIISEWEFTDAKAIPRPSAQVHMNLYLVNGTTPPFGDGALSVTIDGFQFTPPPKR
jgi:hypothetical protein